MFFLYLSFENHFSIDRPSLSSSQVSLTLDLVSFVFSFSLSNKKPKNEFFSRRISNFDFFVFLRFQFEIESRSSWASSTTSSKFVFKDVEIEVFEFIIESFIIVIVFNFVFERSREKDEQKRQRKENFKVRDKKQMSIFSSTRF